MPVADAENVTIPPTVQINRMSDKLKSAMEKGSVAAAKAAADAPPENRTIETTPPPEPPKPVAQPKSDSVVPELKAPEAPKVEVKPEQKTQEQTKKIPSEQFKILEKQRDEFREKAEAESKRAKEFEAKIVEASAIMAELEATRKERDTFKSQAETYKPIVDKVALGETAEFKIAFTDPIARLREEARESVGTEHADKIAKLLKAYPDSARDEQIEAIAEELSGFKQASFSRIYTELKRLERDRDAELSKSTENIGKLHEFQIQQKRQQDEKDRQQLESAFVIEMQKVSELPDFKALDGNADHNNAVEENKKMAKVFLSVNNPTERARLALWAAKGFSSLRTDQIKDALIAKLQAQVNEMQAANPNLKTGSASTQMGQQTEAKEKAMTFSERFKKAFNEGVPPKE